MKKTLNKHVQQQANKNNATQEKCSSSKDKELPFNCPAEYYECICHDCEYLETEQVTHPGGGLSTVDKYKCEQGFWEDDF